MKEISIGVLTFVGEVQGSHVHVTVLGDGIPGQRPHCGRFTVNHVEWQQLVHTATAMLLAARPHSGELARLDLELAKARAELAMYQPIRSVIGDWDWNAIVEDGVTIPSYDDALTAAAKALACVEGAQALAHVEAERAKERGRG